MSSFPMCLLFLVNRTKLFPSRGLSDKNRHLMSLIVGTFIFQSLLNSIAAEVPVFAADLHMENSTIRGLEAFAKGFVKDGWRYINCCNAKVNRKHRWKYTFENSREGV